MIFACTSLPIWHVLLPSPLRQTLLLQFTNASYRRPTAPLCSGATTLSSEGTQEKKQHLESFVFQFLISWISLKIVLSILPEWQLFISLEGEILNITFSFVRKMILFIWTGFYFVLFTCPKAPNVTLALQKCSTLCLWISPSCQAWHTCLTF